MSHKPTALLLLLIIVSICSSDCQAQKAFTITGNIKGLTDTLVYLKERGSKKADSTVIHNGTFSFTGSAPSPFFATIYSKTMSRGIGLIIDQGNIAVNGSADSLNKVTITGIPANDEWNAHLVSKKELASQLRAAYKLNNEASGRQDPDGIATSLAQIDSVQKLIDKRDKSYIVEHPASSVSLLLLEELKGGLEFTELHQLFSALDTSLQNTPRGVKIVQQLATLDNRADGRSAIVFTQNNVHGKPVDLSAFKGKYVLIDFWASWCGPCRAENPNLVKTYNKYSNKGFTILGVSLDENREKWIAAIAKDKLTWEHVSDLKGWKNEAALKYEIHYVPANFLINPNGIIIAHNLYSEDLDNKLAQLLR
ncbi:MAG: TlpA disulfide reductase family protein [Chitinophagaceae bacterium]